jgi:hypothetical protein
VVLLVLEPALLVDLVALAEQMAVPVPLVAELVAQPAFEQPALPLDLLLLVVLVLDRP